MEKALRPPSGLDVKLRFNPGASERQIRSAERALHVTLPPELRSLLAQSDGVRDLMRIKGRWITIGSAIWSLAEIVKERRRVHLEGISPPRSWLVFVNMGVDGIVFGYDLNVSTARIWSWDPMASEKRVVAPSLVTFLRRILSGRLGG